ncbi:MAG: hypothetical protein LKK08_08905 [Bacteroidales bacterium]|jgi:tetratricopeptide (TPR) repeat protein|nr:hypothetical protein [Bacteroidales bacterium]
MKAGKKQLSAMNFKGSMTSFRAAEEEASKTKDYRLLGDVNSEIADIYAKTFANKESLDRNLKALAYYRKAGVGDEISDTYLKLGNNYLIRKYYDSTRLYYNRAIEMFSRSKDTAKILYCYSLLMRLYNTNYYEYDVALKTGGEVRSNYRLRKGDDIYYELSYSFAEIGQMDSAKFYYNLFQDNANSYYRSLILQTIINEKEGNLEKAIRYKQISEHYADSIKLAKSASVVREADKAADMAKMDLEEERMEMKVLSILLFAIIIILLALLLSMFLHDSRRNSSELRAKIDSMQSDYQIVVNGMDKHFESLAKLMEVSSRYGDCGNALSKKVISAVQAVERDEGLRKEIYSLANLRSGGLMDRIKSSHPDITEKEMNLISMVYCRFSPMAIGLLLDYKNVQTVYSVKNKIRRKLASTGSLEDYLASESTPV